MKSAEELIRLHLPTQNVMQLATCVDDQPWVCNVHYCHDEVLNLYWISDKSSRHSKEIAQNPKASVVIKIHENTAAEPYLIGISIEGKASVITDEKQKHIAAKLYIAKHATRQDFIDKVMDDSNGFAFYCLTSTKFVLFDTKDFKDQPRQEWTRGDN
jgi:uncharacterized protein YhbP (UPF0306 family)